MKKDSQAFFLDVVKKADRVARILHRDWMEKHSYSVEDLRQAILVEFVKAIKIEKKAIDRTTAFLMAIGNNLKMNIHKKKNALIVESELSGSEEASVVNECEAQYDPDSATDRKELLEALLKRSGITGSRASMYVDYEITGLTAKQLAGKYNMTERGVYFALSQIHSSLMQTVGITIKTVVSRLRKTEQLNMDHR